MDKLTRSVLAPGSQAETHLRDLAECHYPNTYLQGTYQNPPKIHLDLQVDPKTGEVVDYANIMAAYLSNGFYGSKIISITQDGKKSSSLLSLYQSRGQGDIVHHGTMDFLKPTQLRCALLAEMILYYTMSHAAKPTVGIVGLGHIGQMIVDRLKHLGVSFVFYVRNQADKERALRIVSKYDLTGKSSISFSYEDLCSDCEYIITATSADYGANKIEYHHLRSPIKLISFDSGYIIGPSIRPMSRIYTDSIPQLKGFFEGGDEFPYDEPLLPDNVWDMKELLRNEAPSSWQLYFTGMAVFDVLLAINPSAAILYTQTFELV